MSDRGDRKGSCGGGGGDERPAKRAKVDPVPLRVAIAEGVETSVPLNTIPAGLDLSDAWFIQHLLPFITWARDDDLFDVNKALQARSKSLKPPVKRLYDTAKFYIATPLPSLYIDANDWCCFWEGKDGKDGTAVFAATCTALASGVETKTTRLVMRNIDTLLRKTVGVGPSLARFVRMFKGLHDLELYFGDVEDEAQVNRSLGPYGYGYGSGSKLPWYEILQCHAQLERLVMDGGSRTVLSRYGAWRREDPGYFLDAMAKVQWPRLHTLHCRDIHFETWGMRDIKKGWPTYLQSTLESLDIVLWIQEKVALVPAVTNLVAQCPQLRTLRLRFQSDHSSLGDDMDKALGVVAGALGSQLVDLGWTNGWEAFEEASIGIGAGIDALVRCTQLRKLAMSLANPVESKDIGRILHNLPLLTDWHYQSTVKDDRMFVDRVWPRDMQRLFFRREWRENDKPAAGAWLKMLEASGKRWRQLPSMPTASSDMLLRMTRCTPQLRAIQLESTDADVRTLFPIIQQLVELRQLHIVHTTITHELIEVVAKNLPQLRDLRIWHAHEAKAPARSGTIVKLITDGALLRLAQSCRHLQSVRMQVLDAFGSYLTRDGLHHFFKQGVFLRRFEIHAGTGLGWEGGVRLPYSGTTDAYFAREVANIDQPRPIYVSLKSGTSEVSFGSNSSRITGDRMDDLWD
jgi:hypothetical protein